MSETIEKVKCLIIGSGPAGYTAAIYASRANMEPVLYQGTQPGGQLTTTNDVENFPGYPDGITGPEMMIELQKQAERFGTDIRHGWITKVDFSGDIHKVWVNDEKEIHCDTVIISTGASAKYLGLESEQKYLELGGGVSACAVCDGFFYRNQEVVIVGAGDSACEEAHYLSKLCKKVTMVVRRDVFRASKIMANRVQQTPNIEILRWFVAVFLTGILTNFVSNAAAVAINAPIVLNMGGDPVVIGFATAIASSFAYLTVVASPTCMTIHSSGLVKSKDYLKAGWKMFLMSAVVLFFISQIW